MTTKSYRFVVQWKGSKELVTRAKTMSSAYSYIKWFKRLHGEANASQLEIHDVKENKIV